MNWYKIAFCFDGDGGDNMIVKKCTAPGRLRSPSNFVRVKNVWNRKRSGSYFENWRGVKMDYVKVWVMANSEREAIAQVIRNLFMVAIGMYKISALTEA